MELLMRPFSSYLRKSELTQGARRLTVRWESCTADVNDVGEVCMDHTNHWCLVKIRLRMEHLCQRNMIGAKL